MPDEISLPRETNSKKYTKNPKQTHQTIVLLLSYGDSLDQ